ncbi:MAG: NAD(P)-dependent oxidoreductase [Chromatiales bacterium]|jgi:uronate dehydrogenase|nr:NAD(P)-dependent oxidoreductase [Chromatiales bacterium]
MTHGEVGVCPRIVRLQFQCRTPQAACLLGGRQRVLLKHVVAAQQQIIGARINFRHLRQSRLLTRRQGDGQGVDDVTDLDAMEALMSGAGGLIALGGESREHDWERILDCNIRGMYHHYEAARRAGVRRVVFASSNHAVGFYRRDETIAVDVTPRPDSRYGVSKAFGESMGALYANKYGLQVMCIRIGNVADRPVDKRRLAIWVSPRDLAQLVTIGLEHPDIEFEIVYGMSDNARGWWDNANAARLGYAPADRSEDYADEVLAREPASDPASAPETFQGGDFTQAEVGGGRPAGDSS